MLVIELDCHKTRARAKQSSNKQAKRQDEARKAQSSKLKARRMQGGAKAKAKAKARRANKCLQNIGSK